MTCRCERLSLQLGWTKLSTTATVSILGTYAVLKTGYWGALCIFNTLRYHVSRSQDIPTCYVHAKSCRVQLLCRQHSSIDVLMSLASSGYQGGRGDRGSAVWPSLGRAWGLRSAPPPSLAPAGTWVGAGGRSQSTTRFHTPDLGCCNIFMCLVLW